MLISEDRPRTSALHLVLVYRGFKGKEEEKDTSALLRRHRHNEKYIEPEPTSVRVSWSPLQSPAATAVLLWKRKLADASQGSHMYAPLSAQASLLIRVEFLSPNKAPDRLTGL